MEEDGGCDDLDQGDNGWKIIHTDVFRFPPYKSLLCAVLGVGAQFLTLATGIMIEIYKKNMICRWEDHDLEITLFLGFFRDYCHGTAGDV